MKDKSKKIIAGLTTMGMLLSFSGCGYEKNIDPRYEFAQIGDLAPEPDAPKYKIFDGKWHKLIPTSRGYEYIPVDSSEVPEYVKPGYKEKITKELKENYDTDDYVLHPTMSYEIIENTILKYSKAEHSTIDKVFKKFQIKENFNEYTQIRNSGNINEIKKITKKLYLNVLKAKSIIAHLSKIENLLPKNEYIYDDIIDIIKDAKIYTTTAPSYIFKVEFNPIKKIVSNNTIIDYVPESQNLGTPNIVDEHEVSAFYDLIYSYDNIVKKEECDKFVNSLLKHLPCNISSAEYEILEEIMKLNNEHKTNQYNNQIGSTREKIEQLNILKSHALNAKVAKPKQEFNTLKYKKI